MEGGGIGLRRRATALPPPRTQLHELTGDRLGTLGACHIGIDKEEMGELVGQRALQLLAGPGIVLGEGRAMGQLDEQAGGRTSGIAVDALDRTDPST